MGGTRARPGSAPAVGRDKDLVAAAEGLLTDARRSLKSMNLLDGIKPDEKKRLRMVFKAIDVNGDGRITAQELRAAMRRDGIHLTVKAADDMLWEICEDRVERGATFREFALCYVRAKKGMHEPHTLYSYLFFKMMDEENAGDDPDELVKENGLRKDAVVKYLVPQVGDKQIKGYVNALFGSALGEEEEAEAKRKTLFSMDVSGSPASRGNTTIRRSATEDFIERNREVAMPVDDPACDILTAQTFCRVAQTALWRDVPEGKVELVPFERLELRRPISVRMQEQTAIIRQQFKILEADEKLQKTLARKKLNKMTTMELRHQKAIEMKEKAKRIREEFGDTLRLKLRVHSDDLNGGGDFTPAEQYDEDDVLLANGLGVGVAELQRTKDVFVQLDKDGNGRIDFDEFRGALGRLMDEKELETTHIKRVWEHLCIPPMKDVPFMDFAKWYVKHFVQHQGKPDIQGLLGQSRKVYTPTAPEEIAAWHPKRK
jgi:Ca2+-binding EF-hand superfamily protein